MTRTRQIRAFTMVEILVAMGIIVILAGMLFTGLRYSSAKAKADTTRTMLQTLRGMYTEREIAAGATQFKGQVNDTFKAAYTASTTYANDASGVIKHVDSGFDDQRYPNGTPTSTPPYGTNAVGVTEDIMSMLLSVSSNKSVIANLSQGQFLEQKGTAPWNPPVLLDGYGYPIIMVPTVDQVTGKPTGLKNVTLNGVNQAFIASPDGKPFFASPGPDGDFSTGDDNVYSFQN